MIALYNPKLNQYYNSDENRYTNSLFIKINGGYYPNTKLYNSVDDAQKDKENIDNNELVITKLQLKLIKND